MAGRARRGAPSTPRSATRTTCRRGKARMARARQTAWVGEWREARGRLGGGRGAARRRVAGRIGRGWAGSGRADGSGRQGQTLQAGVLHAVGRDVRPLRGRACPLLHVRQAYRRAVPCRAVPRRVVPRRAARGARRPQAAPLVAGRATTRGAATRAGAADARQAPRVSGPRGHTLSDATRRSMGITRWQGRRRNASRLPVQSVTHCRARRSAARHRRHERRTRFKTSPPLAPALRRRRWSW